MVGAIFYHVSALLHAQLSRVVGCRGDALDHGCLHQYIDGAIPGICWRQPAYRAALPWVFAMQSFFIGTGAVVASALPYISDQLVWCSQYCRGGDYPAIGEAVVLHWWGGAFPLGLLYRFYFQRVLAR